MILLDDDSRPLRDYNFPMGTVYFLDQVLVIKDTGKKHKDDFVSQWALANAELLAVSSGKSTVLHYIVK